MNKYLITGLESIFRWNGKPVEPAPRGAGPLYGRLAIHLIFARVFSFDDGLKW
jgi:hypothetical protein